MHCKLTKFEIGLYRCANVAKRIKDDSGENEEAENWRERQKLWSSICFKVAHGEAKSLGVLLIPKSSKSKDFFLTKKARKNWAPSFVLMIWSANLRGREDEISEWNTKDYIDVSKEHGLKSQNTSRKWKYPDAIEGFLEDRRYKATGEFLANAAESMAFWYPVTYWTVDLSLWHCNLFNWCQSDQKLEQNLHNFVNLGFLVKLFGSYFMFHTVCSLTGNFIIPFSCDIDH